jgi:hypothetical protein
MDGAGIGPDSAGIGENAGQNEGAGLRVEQAHVGRRRGRAVDGERAAAGNDRAGGVVAQYEPGEPARAGDEVVDVLQRVGDGDADDVAGGKGHRAAAPQPRSTEPASA